MNDVINLGRDLGRGPLVPCCVLRWKDGNILFEKEDPRHGPSQAERTAILRAFATPLRVLTGGTRDGREVDESKVSEPGTIEHFQSVGYTGLPLPFHRYPGVI